MTQQTEKILDYISSLNKDENNYLESFLQANRGSKVGLADCKQAISFFRTSKVKELKDTRSIEQRLASAGNDIEAKGKILDEAGLNPLNTDPIFCEAKDLYSEVSPDELNEMEGVKQYDYYDPKDKSVSKMLDAIEERSKRDLPELFEPLGTGLLTPREANIV